MNGNNTAATLPEPLKLEIVPAVPSDSRAITSKAGRTTGMIYKLGLKSASQLKEEFKALGLRGNDLKAKINEALSSDASARKIAAFAAIEFAHKSKGLLPDEATLRTNSGMIKLVSGGKATDSEAQKRVKELEAKTAEQDKALAELREQLSKLMAAGQKESETQPELVPARPNRR